MAAALGLLFLSTCTLHGLANPLQTFSSSPHLLPELLPVSNLSAPSTLNASSSSENAGLEITCSGEYFGMYPNIVDCESAKSYISPDFTQFTWGTRHSGLGDDVFPLPFRIMGDRGLCFFQATLLNTEARTARASLSQIRSAASALILRCAAVAESQGGMATNIGGDNNLAVILGTYRSHNVRCRGAFGPEWSSCRDILGDMPALQTPLIFGPRSAPEVQQVLPARINSADHKCMAQIFSTGKPDVSDWYRMWEGVTAVFSVCVRNGRGGVVTGLGNLGNIFLTMRSTAGVGGIGIGNGSAGVEES